MKGEIGGSICWRSALTIRRSWWWAIKLPFNLEPVLQAVDRAGASDEVWLAAKLSGRGKGRESDARFRNLCRGSESAAGGRRVQRRRGVVSRRPGPRRDPRRRSRLIAEHQRRAGDPVAGRRPRQPIMTAYRQQALACAAAMSGGPNGLAN